jgi:hypothetical protein
MYAKGMPKPHSLRYSDVTTYSQSILRDTPARLASIIHRFVNTHVAERHRSGVLGGCGSPANHRTGRARDARRVFWPLKARGFLASASTNGAIIGQFRPSPPVLIAPLRPEELSAHVESTTRSVIRGQYPHHLSLIEGGRIVKPLPPSASPRQGHSVSPYGDTDAPKRGNRCRKRGFASNVRKQRPLFSGNQARCRNRLEKDARRPGCSIPP